MLHAETINDVQQPQERADGTIAWIPALPEPDPILARVRDAWEVLRGNARAVVWPE